MPQSPAVCHGGDFHRGVDARARVDQGQHHHRQDGADRTESHQAEAVLGGILVAADGGHAHAQGHDKGHGHGTRGDAAGVEGDGQEVLRYKEGQRKHEDVEHDQHPVQGNAEQDAQHGDHQKNAHAHGHSAHQRGVGHAGHLLGQHLKIRLRHGDDDADQKADSRYNPELSGAGHGGAHPFSDGGHGGVSAQGKQADAQNHHHRADQKGQQRLGGDGRNSKAEDQHDHRNGDHGGQGFPELFPEDGFIPPQSFLPLLSSLPRQSHHLSKIHTIYIDMIIIT